jgi:hypothetical protein
MPSEVSRGGRVCGFGRRVPSLGALMFTGLVTFGVDEALAQSIDRTQAPNAAGAGIARSLAEQVGAGQGDVYTGDSSTWTIHRDPARAIRRGRQLFQRKFTLAQGVGPATGDGAGDIAADGRIGAGLSDSCASCHGRPRGSAGFGGDVATRPDSRDAPHLFGLGLQEMLADEITRDLRAIRAKAVERAARRGFPVRSKLTSKGISFGSISAAPDGSVDASRVSGVDPDLRVRPFFAHGQTLSIREFVVGALQAEMGLQAWDPCLAAAVAGGSCTTAGGLQLDGSLDAIEAPPLADPREDRDADGIAAEIDPALVDFLEFYLLNYFKPATGRQDARTRAGFQTMEGIGCTGCHVRDLWIDHDRRVADVETRYDPRNGVFNELFAQAATRFVAVDDGYPLPRLEPEGQAFLVRNVFTDFKRHDLGPAFHERQYDGSLRREFVTEPLWGVGSTPPYGHDGRSIDLEQVILRHGGEAERSRRRFASLSSTQREHVLAALRSLVLFPPDDTASNLDPGDRSHPDFPQTGHGSIALGVLFQTPGPE